VGDPIACPHGVQYRQRIGGCGPCTEEQLEWLTAEHSAEQAAHHRTATMAALWKRLAKALREERDAAMAGNTAHLVRALGEARNLRAENARLRDAIAGFRARLGERRRVLLEEADAIEREMLRERAHEPNGDV